MRSPSRILRILGSPGSIPACAVLLAIYLGVTAWGVHNHQPWRDEAQKWLIARDTASVAELGRLLPYEGTPALWPLLLRPLARGGFPYASMSWLNWALTGAAAALLLFAAPLPWPLKAAILSSYGMLYQNPVFASNYSLSLLLLFAALALYGERRARPLRLGLAVALLANTSVLGAILALPLAAVIGAELVRERPASRRPWIASALMAAGFALLVLQILPSRLGTGSSIENEFFNPYLGGRRGILSIASEAFFPYVTSRLLSYDALGAVGVLFLLLTAVGVSRRPKAFLVLASSSLLLFLLFHRVASVGLRHTGFLVLAVVAALWIAGIERREAGRSPGPRVGGGGAWTLPEAGAAAMAAVVIGCACLGSVARLRFEAGSMLSRSREVAEVIAAGGHAGAPIVAYPAGAGSALLPYLPGVRFWYPGLGEYGTFIRQGARLWEGEAALSPDRVLRGAFCQFPPGAPYLVLLGDKPTLDLSPFCTSLYAPPRSGPRSYEDYWLYACNARAPDGRVFHPALCRE